MPETKPIRDLRTCNPQRRIDALVAQGIEQLVEQQKNPLASTVLDMFRPLVHQQLRRTIGPRALPDLHKAMRRNSTQGDADNRQSTRPDPAQSEHTGNRGAGRTSGGLTRADALKIFALTDAATPEEISAAYRAIATLYHPDKFISKPPELQRFAENKMRELNAAYELLKGGEVNSQGIGTVAAVGLGLFLLYMVVKSIPVPTFPTGSGS